MNINCQPPLQFVYFSTDTHIPWISHNTLRDRLFKNGVAIRKKVYWEKEKIQTGEKGFMSYMTNTLNRIGMTNIWIEQLAHDNNNQLKKPSINKNILKRFHNIFT